MVKKEVRGPEILLHKNWHTSVRFFAKEVSKSMADWLGSLPPLTTYSVQVELYCGGRGMDQFNNLFKMLLSAHEKYNALIEDEARAKDDKYFDEIKTRYFPLRRDYYACWRMLKKITYQKAHLKEAETLHQEYQKHPRHQRNQGLLEN